MIRSKMLVAAAFAAVVALGGASTASAQSYRENRSSYGYDQARGDQRPDYGWTNFGSRSDNEGSSWGRFGRTRYEWGDRSRSEDHLTYGRGGYDRRNDDARVRFAPRHFGRGWDAGGAYGDEGR